PTLRLEEIAEIDFGLFFEAWNLVEEGYDGDIPNNQEILYSALEGSLDTLGDEYTRFIRPEVAARLREDAGGSVEGIGAYVEETEEGQFRIVRPIPDQPADLAGLLPGDVVVAVNGESVDGISFDEVIMLVRGPRGTEVTLTILREDEPELLDFTITRVRFEIATVESEMLEGNIAYIKLTTFDQTATEKTVEALQTLLDQGAESVVFDLRDNPGGFLAQSISISDLFLADSVVLYERNTAGLDQVFRADTGDLGEGLPMVVLVNGGSASASEIVAGAIKDNGRAVLIGEVSFGKGSVQQVYQLSDGSEMRVTIARWYTPSNISIDKEGVTPDIIVEMEFDAEEDIQLQRAIEYLQNGQ
ncbi:MAG: S41 family peptidase, partial [Candidatus Promineifilaceae bacterium]